MWRNFFSFFAFILLFFIHFSIFYYSLVSLFLIVFSVLFFFLLSYWIEWKPIFSIIQIFIFPHFKSFKINFFLFIFRRSKSFFFQCRPIYSLIDFSYFISQNTVYLQNSLKIIDQIRLIQLINRTIISWIRKSQ